MSAHANHFWLLPSKIKHVFHVVSAAGIETDLAKVDMKPTPTNKSQLHHFLVFAGYYHQFIKDYSKMAKKLYDSLGNQCN